MSNLDGDYQHKVFDTDGEKFDSEAATTAMLSKHTTSKMNSMFMDTKMFNMSKPQYMKELGLPGSLERIDKLPESPFQKGNKEGTNFSAIKSIHK